MIFHKFSYAEYSLIIDHFSRANTIMDYADVNDKTPNFCVIRHDVEFSVDRALALARYEHEFLDLKTSYLFQLRNNCYNICSDINLAKIHEVMNMGHKVGLHVHVGVKRDSESFPEYISREVEIFKSMSGIDIDRFSYHRPPQDVLEQYIEVPGLIDCYGKLFFQYFKEVPKELDIKYYTDSRHKWQYGHPLNSPMKKVQLLTHPYSWAARGYSNNDNYAVLLGEKYREIRESINRETSTFPQDLLHPSDSED